MARLFIAAWPDTGTVDALRSIPRSGERGVRWTHPDHWHVTLRFLGEAESDTVFDRLTDTTLPRSVATVGPELGRIGGRHVVVPVGGLDELAAAVTDATADLGQPPGPTFVGHLTLGRCDRNVTSSLHGTPFSSEFAVDEVTLVASELTSAGSTYTTLGRFATVATR